MGPPMMRPPMGPGFGFGSNGYPPPPRKKSKAAVFVLVPLMLLVVGVVGLLTVSRILKHNGDDSYTQPEPTYTATTNPTEEPTDPPSSAPITTEPTEPATTTTTTTTEPSTTRTTPPEPSDIDLVAKNRIYKTGVQKTVNCRESGARANSVTNARKYYNNILSCLVRAWPAQVKLAGGRFVAPHLIGFLGTATTPCGGNAPSSFYCPTNRTIYMDAANDIAQYKKYVTYSNRTEALAFLRADMTDTVAHEFGHHIQNMTGILQAETNLEYQYTGDKSLEFSRRTELQATCFGNVFMGANKTSYKITGQLKKQLDYLHSHEGDEYGSQRDHGSREVVPRWANAGFSTRSPRSCNTFTASPKYVR
jgi:predicted metalloprotease